MATQPDSLDKRPTTTAAVQLHEHGGGYGEEPPMSIGEQDDAEEKSLNEDYSADELNKKKDEVIDTNPEGSPHPTPDHGLVEEGPGPDA